MGDRPAGNAGQLRRGVHSRRTVLRAALGAAGGALLAACGGEAPPALTPSGGSGGATTAIAGGGPAATPIATPAAGGAATARATATTATARATAASSPVADADGIIRSTVPGVPDLYTKIPAVYKSVPAVPGRGGKVTSFHISYGNPPLPSRAENQYWQELEKRLGVTLEPTVAPVGSYQEKLATLTASGDLPDLTLIVLAAAPDQHKIIQQGAWTDLTPYLTGDALKEFPHLAAFPDYIWKNLTIKGKIYGAPRPTSIASNTMMFRQDWAAKLGMPRPKNADEFFQLLVAMTRNDPDGNGQADTWGLGANGGDYNLSFFEAMFRVPNNWRLNPDGTLTAAIETEEYRQAVDYARRLFAAGVYHPEAATMNTQQAKQLFAGGKFGGYTDGTGAVGGLRLNTRKVTPDADPVGLVPIGHDGGPAVTHKGTGLIGFVAIPAKVGRDRERVRELLRLMNYYCAPFGSEEQIFMANGIEGVHHKVNPDGSRTRNERGSLERGDLANLAQPQQTLFVGGADPTDARRQQQLLEGMLAIGIDDPARNAFSATYAAKANELSQLEEDRIGAIITGRAPLAALDGFLKEWRGRGGDQVRKEYEEDLKTT